MSVPSVDTGVTVHHCQRCGRVVPKKPKGGRPYQFCPDSEDEPGTSCLELDKRERAALERAGLGELVSAFRVQQDALAADVAPLREYAARVDDLETLVRQIAQVAVARAEQAAQDQLRAEEERRAAVRDAREAEQRTTRAYQLRDEALDERNRAVEDEQQARRDADDAIERALKAEHARGQAQGIAEANARALQDERQRREDTEGVVDRLRREITSLQGDLDGARAALGDADRAAAQQRLEHEQELAEAGRAEARLRLEHQEQLAVASRELAVAHAELRSARTDSEALQNRTELLAAGVERAQQQATALQNDLETVRAKALRDADWLTQQATTADEARAEAERRYHDLVTALQQGGFTARTDAAPADE